MKAINDRTKRNLALAMTLAIGFVGGYISKEMTDKSNSVHASEAASVPVQKVQSTEVAKLNNHLIAPHLWDIYIDPLFVPVQWMTKPMPLLPLIDVPAQTPKLQTIDKDKELRVIVQVPGMNEKDVKVEASDQSVTIKAHKVQEEKDKGKFETFDESFEQSVHLPCKVDADKVQASVKDGILTVTLPKS